MFPLYTRAQNFHVYEKIFLGYYKFYLVKCCNFQLFWKSCKPQHWCITSFLHFVCPKNVICLKNIFYLTRQNSVLCVMTPKIIFRFSQKNFLTCRQNYMYLWNGNIYEIWIFHPNKFEHHTIHTHNRITHNKHTANTQQTHSIFHTANTQQTHSKHFCKHTANTQHTHSKHVYALVHSKRDHSKHTANTQQTHSIHHAHNKTQQLHSKHTLQAQLDSSETTFLNILSFPLVCSDRKKNHTRFLIVLDAHKSLQKSTLRSWPNQNVVYAPTFVEAIFNETRPRRYSPVRQTLTQQFSQVSIEPARLRRDPRRFIQR